MQTRRQFESLLRSDGIVAAMRWLNSLVPYRYSAVFRFDGDMLTNICLIDKENPDISACPTQPITQSYCMYVREAGANFGVDASLTDQRVEGHPKRQAFQCYYGSPLFGPTGKMLGTVCHFDIRPLPVTSDVASVLDDIGPSIATELAKPEDRIA